MNTRLSLFGLVGVTVAALGCGVPAQDEPDLTSAESASTESNLDDLPDGTYRVPATSSFPISSGARARGVCSQRLDVYVVEKKAGKLTVTGGPHIGPRPLVADGTVKSGEFDGFVDYAPCSYCKEVRQRYTVKGSLRYDGQAIELVARYTGGWIQGSTWKGQLGTTLLGADELPAGAQHGSAEAISGKLDGRWDLWDIGFARDASGKRFITLPRRSGDLPVWVDGDAGPGASMGCYLPRVSVVVDGATARVGWNVFSLPEWFTAP
jgi:hypothetical protein